MTEKNQQNPFEDSSRIKVLVCEPSGGQVEFQCHDNRLDFSMELARLESRRPFKFFTGLVGRMPINYARQMMAEQAISLNMDYLFMVDDDMIVTKDCFERIYDVLKANQADMAAPLCTQRVYPYKPVIYKHTWIKDDVVPEKLNLKNDHIEDYEPNSVITVDGFGFGVALISVPFLKKMAEKMPHGMFFSNTNIGEDIWFCIQARRQFNAKIVVDTAVKVGHLKHPEFVTEWDWVKATGQQEKFKNVYTPEGKIIPLAEKVAA